MQTDPAVEYRKKTLNGQIVHEITRGRVDERARVTIDEKRVLRQGY